MTPVCSGKGKPCMWVKVTGSAVSHISTKITRIFKSQQGSANCYSRLDPKNNSVQGLIVGKTGY